MKSTLYKDFNLNSSFADFNGAMRYLRGKDQVTIKLDDPDFFAVSAADADNVSMLSSLRRTLRKRQRKKKKEVH